MVLKLTGDDEVRSAPLLKISGGEPRHTDEFNSSQSAKLHLALGDQSPGLPEVSTAMSTGNVDTYKQLLADRDRIQKMHTQQDVLQTILESDPTAVTPEVVNVVQGLSEMELRNEDLSGIIEKKYSNLYTNTATASLQNGIVEEAIDADPDASYDLLDRAEVVAYKQNLAASKLDEVKKDIEDQGYLGVGYNFVESMFLGQYQMYDQVEADFVSSVLPGGNREEQYAYLWGLSDPEEFRTAFDSAVTDLRERNPYTAQQWLQGFFSFGGADATMESVFAVADAASLVPVGILGKALKGVARGASKNPMRTFEITKDLGQYDNAAVGKAVDDLQNGSFLGDIRNAKEVENSIPSIASPDKLLTGSQNVPQAAYLRLKEALIERADLAQRFLLDANQIDRATPDELLQYKDVLLRDYEKTHPNIQKNVIDVEIDTIGDVGNVYQARVILGRRDGTLFESAKQAENYFKRWIGGTTDYRINQIGQGFQVEVLKTVDETKIASDIHLGTTQRTPTSLANTFGGLIRSPDYMLSEQNVLARSTAVTSTEYLNELFVGLTEPLRRLPKNELAELEDLMVINRDKQMYYENYGEFEQAFWSRFKKPPTETQTDAYFSYIQVNDLDLVVRDLDVYKQKARMGIEDITLKTTDGDIQFEGKVVESLPYGSSDYWSMTFIDADGPRKPVSGRFITETHKENIQKLLDNGYKIIQVADQAFKVGEDYAGYIITKDASRNRVGVKNIGRKAGGHQVHKYPYYIKQGMISGDDAQNLYRGDRTFLNFRSEKEAKDFLEVMETARVKYLRQDADAMKYIRDNLPMGTKGWMTAVNEGTINLNVPFAVTRRGIRTLDTGAYQGLKNLTDISKNEHNLQSKVSGRYLGERGETDLKTVQSEGDVQFEVEPAPYLAPMETLRVSSTNMLSTRAMNDYTLMTRDNFFREFSDILEGTLEEQKASGVSLLMEPRFKAGATPERMAAAKNVSRAYNNLMNYGTPLDKKVEFYKEQLLSSVMPKFGPRGQQWVEDRLLAKTKDPGAYFRSFAFNMKLGLFNVQQYFIQANSMVNIASLGGMAGARSAGIYPILRAALLTSDDNILRHGAKIAESVGAMKADEFLESVSLMKKSGWNDIGGDVAYMDDVASPELRKGDIQKGVGAILKWGRTPFQEGERMVRIAAWNTAYLERKALARGRRLDRRDTAAILLRAKNLTGNMTRESNATWQKGYAAVFTQFFGYQARIAEQFLGKKLTPTEKLRLFTGYSAVYGLPVAMGATTGVIPVRDIAMDTLAGMGIDPDDTAWEPLLDGFAASMTEYITGYEPNVADRYGPGGLPTFYDLWRGDKELTDTLFGASGSIALDTIQSSIPMFKGMYSEFLDFEGGYYNLTADDFLDPLRNISSVDNALKLYNVWNFGVWASKNGTNIIEMDLPEGVMAAMTGLQPSEIEDSFVKLRATQDFKEHIKSAQKEFVKEYRRAMKMEDGPEREKIVRGIKSRMILEGFNLKEMAQTWRYANDKEMMTDSLFEEYEKLQRRKEKIPNG